MKIIIILFFTSFFLFQCKYITVINNFSKQWIIESKSVGAIKLGKPLPKKIINKNKNIHKQYFSTYIADGRIFEGFKINTPPLLVGIKNGPLHLWEKKFGSKKHSNNLSLEAIKAANNGAIVEMIIINSKEYKTKNSIGVSSTYDELLKAYPDILKNKVPPTLGSDLCSAYTSELKNVYFYFKNCKDADNNGKIVRIMIFE